MSKQFKTQTAAVIARNKARKGAAHAKRVADKQAKRVRPPRRHLPPGRAAVPAVAVVKVKPDTVSPAWIGVMRNAFDSILMRHINFKTAKGVAASVSGALNTHMGMWNMGKGWNAHLSFKTAQKLKAEGILV